MIALSTGRRAEVEGLQDYLFANVYRHPRVMAVMAGAETIVSQLFERYMGEPALMPSLGAPLPKPRAEPEMRQGALPWWRTSSRHDGPLCRAASTGACLTLRRTCVSSARTATHWPAGPPMNVYALVHARILAALQALHVDGVLAPRGSTSPTSR